MHDADLDTRSETDLIVKLNIKASLRARSASSETHPLSPAYHLGHHAGKRRHDLSITHKFRAEYEAKLYVVLLYALTTLLVSTIGANAFQHLADSYQRQHPDEKPK